MFLKSAFACLAVTAASAQTFAPHVPFTTSSHVHSALAVRGGGGISADTTAKIATGLFGAQGAYGVLAPVKENEAYGFPGHDDVLNFLAETNGSILLNWAVAAYCIFFKRMNAMTALGAGMIVSVAIHLKSLLNGTYEKLGANTGGQWLNIGLSTFMAHTLLNGASYSKTAAYLYAVFEALIGLQCYFDPDGSCKTWGSSDGVSDESKLKLRVVGQNLLCLCVFISSIAKGIEPTKALGYSFIPLVLSCANIAVSGALDKVGVKKEGLYFWLAVLAASVPKLAL